MEVCPIASPRAAQCSTQQTFFATVDALIYFFIKETREKGSHVIVIEMQERGPSRR